jgi:integrase
MEPEAKPKARKEPDVQAFFDAINRKSDSGKRFYAIAMLTYATGARIGEVLSITMTGLDLTKGTVYLAKTKNGKPRTAAIVCLDEVREAIDDWYSVREEWNPSSDLLFVTRPKCDGKGSEAVVYRSVVRAFDTVSDRAGLVSAIHPHQLRHTFACEWLEAGGSLSALADQLGHSDKSITARYYLMCIGEERARGVVAMEKMRAKRGA